MTIHTVEEGESLSVIVKVVRSVSLKVPKNVTLKELHVVEGSIENTGSIVSALNTIKIVFWGTQAIKWDCVTTGDVL